MVMKPWLPRRRPPVASKEPVLPPPYYRDDDMRPTKNDTAVGGVAPGTAPADLSRAGPAFDGVLWAKANASNVGPYCALHGRSYLVFREILSQFTPAGVPNPYVLLTRNDEVVPKFVRVRLQPRDGLIPSEGRVALGQTSSDPVNNMEWVDLWNNSDHKFECILENGQQLWAIGVWSGVVPISVFVTIAEWMP